MPASFFAKTLRRGGLWVVLGAYPGVFVKWDTLVFGCVFGYFFGFVGGLALCIFILFVVWLCS